MKIEFEWWGVRWIPTNNQDYLLLIKMKKTFDESEITPYEYSGGFVQWGNTFNTEHPECSLEPNLSLSFNR